MQIFKIDKINTFMQIFKIDKNCIENFITFRSVLNKLVINISKILKSFAIFKKFLSNI